MRIAVTRAVSPRIRDCELTFREREPIDPARAAAQHAVYERWIESHGCRIVRAEEAPEHPDGVFVEDTAVVLDEVAVIMRPGAASRRGETGGIARALQRYRAVRSIEEPATMDGGDLLPIGQTLYAGRSRRTNDRAIAQLREIVTPLGYSVVPVLLRDCLHLKTAVTAIGARALLYNPECVDAGAFEGLELVAVDPLEPGAANVLRIGETLLVSSSHPRTRRLLEERGQRVESLDYDEMEKAEAGVTCCSIVFEA
ncbi:MAG TPA: dimethylargininase [Thermoanaerobaculia bacterium]|nr:dimethylargininase [Thermoanaerobaculia bacterium]